MIMENKFDEQIKEVYDSGQLEYNPANWEQLRERMNPSGKKNNSLKLLGLAGILTFKKVAAAASVLLTIGLSANYYYKTKHIQETATITQTQQTPVKPSVNTNHTINPSTSTPTSTPTPLERSVATANANKSSHKAPHASSMPLAEMETSSAHTLFPIKEELASTSIDEKKPEVIADNNPKSTKEFRDNMLNPFVLLPEHTDYEKGNGLSVLGSFGKGTDNTVYSAGVNYQVDLNKRIFVDGAVAFYSSNIQDGARLNENSDTKFLASDNGSGLITAADIESTGGKVMSKQAVYAHVAVNPTIGYKLSKRFSVKAGVDVQKRIFGGGGVSYVESNAVYKPLPTVDVGITPKIGIRLSEHWQSNLIYRKGINDVISKKDYFNRDYFQLQLGYKF